MVAVTVDPDRYAVALVRYCEDIPLNDKYRKVVVVVAVADYYSPMSMAIRFVLLADNCHRLYSI